MHEKKHMRITDFYHDTIWTNILSNNSYINNLTMRFYGCASF
jgi:hypothetical protein